jgi:DNA-binding transcriptional ArsR family regulator
MDELKKLQAIFQTLSDFSRLSILKLICDKECSVGEIVKKTNLSQPLISHHLRILKENDFLETKRNGPFIYYYMKNTKILYAINLFLEIFENSDIKYDSGLKFCPDRIMKKFNN